MDSLRAAPQSVGVLCVDDSPDVLKTLEVVFRYSPQGEGFVWKGTLPSADHLCATVLRLNQIAETEGRARVDVLILDIEMPGKDVFVSAAELLEQTRGAGHEPLVIFFSAGVDNRERALRSVPGSVFVDKNDGMDGLFKAIHQHRPAAPASPPPSIRTA